MQVPVWLLPDYVSCWGFAAPFTHSVLVEKE